MFQFTSTTIINDPSIIKTNAYPSSDESFPEDTVLIKRVATFKKADILSITKALAYDEVIPTAKVTVPEAGSENPLFKKGDVFRLAIYVALSGSQNSYYANDFVQKGKPFYIEAMAKDNLAVNVARDLVENAKKYITMVYEKELVKLTNGKGSAIINISGIDGFQQFKKVELQKWNEESKSWDVLVDTEHANVKAGKPGFGTYQHLIHNYVLPTGANLRFGHILEDEAPKVGAKYNQYIVRMCKDRGIMGGAAVGQPVQSITTHVFWVEQNSVESTFNTAMTILQAPTSVDTDASTDEKVVTHKASTLGIDTKKAN